MSSSTTPSGGGGGGGGSALCGTAATHQPPSAHVAAAAAAAAADGRGGGVVAGSAAASIFGMGSEHQSLLHGLPRKEFLLGSTQRRRALCGLVDLLFAYAYDVRAVNPEWGATGWNAVP